MAVQHQMTGSCLSCGCPVWPWGCRSVGWNDIQEALVSCYFLDVSLYGCCFDCHICLWPLSLTADPWASNHACPLLLCVCSGLALMMVFKPRLLFPHQALPWFAKEVLSAVAKMLRFHLSELGVFHGLLRHSKPVQSGMDGLQSSALLYKDGKRIYGYSTFFSLSHAKFSHCLLSRD